MTGVSNSFIMGTRVLPHGGTPETMPACNECNADLMKEYLWIPLPEAGQVGDSEPRETQYCPFCGSEVESDDEAGLQ